MNISYISKKRSSYYLHDYYLILNLFAYIKIGHRDLILVFYTSLYYSETILLETSKRNIGVLCMQLYYIILKCKIGTSVHIIR